VYTSVLPSQGLFQQIYTVLLRIGTNALPSVCLLGGGEREERESGRMMDAYDVRKAITVLILVCTEYVGLYRYRESGCPILFLSSSSSLRALFGIHSGFLPPPATHATVERGDE
jgi:hypothetical protein